MTDTTTTTEAAPEVRLNLTVVGLTASTQPIELGERGSGSSIFSVDANGVPLVGIDLYYLDNAEGQLDFDKEHNPGSVPRVRIGRWDDNDEWVTLHEIPLDALLAAAAELATHTGTVQQ